MNYNIYFDESGNTGEPRFKNGKWNWGNQPYFTLGSLCIKSSDANAIAKEIIRLLHTFNPQLGDHIEWKSKANNVFNSELLRGVVNIIRKYDGKVYVDITNKKYKICHYLVDYCIYPSYLGYTPENALHRNRRIRIANAVYSDLDESWVKSFESICHNADEDTKYNEFTQFLPELEQALTQKKIVKDLQEVKNYVNNYSNHQMKIKNLFPLIDCDNKGNQTCFLPNLDGYNHILATILNKRIPFGSHITIFHDEQLQFEKALKKWTEDIHQQTMQSVDVQFVQSCQKVYILIQLVDFLTGRIARLYKDIIETGQPKKRDREIFDAAKPLIARNVNVVAPKAEQELFFQQFGLETVLTEIPIQL